MKKSTIAVIGAAALSVSAISLYMRFTEAKGPAIAVFTTLSHPALDNVREGFIEQLKQIAPDYVIKDYNAQGSIQQANVVAREIAMNEDIKLILAIGTLAAQTMAKVEHDRPVIIAAVSNPEGVLPKDGGKNVCGLSDALDASYQIAIIQELLPSVKTLSLLYSPHEANSSSMVEKLEAVAAQKGLEIRLVGVLESQQVQSASQSACQKSDAVLIPLDNQLVASMPAVIKATKDFPCPIITTNAAPIHQGATIAFGIDYRKMGEDAAALLLQLQNKKSPHDIGFIQAHDVRLYGNTRVLREKGLKLEGKVSDTIQAVEG